jgi:hypothetical protein
LSSRCCPFQELQELAWKRVAAVQQLQLFRLGVAAGLLLALKEGTSKGRQEGEVQAAIQQLWSCCPAAFAGENHLEQFLEGLSACVLECCPCWLASSLKVSCCPRSPSRVCAALLWKERLFQQHSNKC